MKWVFWNVDEAGEMKYLPVRIDMVIDAHNCVPSHWLAL